MKLLKKVLSLFVAAAMMIPAFGAFAAGETAANEIVVEESASQVAIGADFVNYGGFTLKNELYPDATVKMGNGKSLRGTVYAPSGSLITGVRVGFYNSYGYPVAEQYASVKSKSYYNFTSMLSKLKMYMLPEGKYYYCVTAYSTNASNGVMVMRRGFTVTANSSLSNPVKDGVYYVASALNNKYVLSVENNSTSNYARLCLTENTSAETQKVVLSWLGNGYYRMTFVYDNMAIDNSSMNDGTLCQQYSINNSAAQQYYVRTYNGMMHIVSRQSGMSLSVCGGVASQNALIENSTDENTKASGWKFVKTAMASAGISNRAEKFATKAASEVGYNAGANGYVKYSKSYNNDGGNEWSVKFVSWCGYSAGYGNTYVSKSGSWQSSIDWFMGKGWFRRFGTYTPRRGDVVYFNNGKAAVVENCIGSILYVIEGNVNGSVARTTYYTNSSSIYGYGVFMG